MGIASLIGFLDRSQSASCVRRSMQEHASNEANPLDPGETLPQDLQRAARFYVKRTTSAHKKVPAALLRATKRGEGRLAAVHKD